MRRLELGLVLPMEESFLDGATARWTEIRELATRAQEIGFDTVWIPDELLWRPPDGQVRGWWECVAMTGAVAASTSRVKVGSWILSALHRNPGITPKAVETLDEISGGRFVFAGAAGGDPACAPSDGRSSTAAVEPSASRSHQLRSSLSSSRPASRPDRSILDP